LPSSDIIAIQTAEFAVHRDDPAMTCPQDISPPPLPHLTEYRLLRLGIAAALGGIVAVLALLSGWNTIDTASVLPQGWTRHGLWRLTEEIQAYAKTNGTLPQKLEDVKNVDVLLDGWKRPFLYTVNGTNFMLLSLGKDGKPGGTGLDCDLTNWDSKPVESKPTLEQFLFEMPSQGMILAAVVSGIMTSVLTWCLIRPKDFYSRFKVGLILKITITVLAAGFIAMCMTALHIPSGH
jgi:hypothetical protein